MKKYRGRLNAAVAELADAHGSEPCLRKEVEVQLLSAAQLEGWQSGNAAAC